MITPAVANLPVHPAYAGLNPIDNLKPAILTTQSLNTSEKAPEETNPLRKGLIRYWGYINEMAEAFAPQLKKAVPFNPLGKDLVSWWSYRLVDVYAGLDGLATTFRTWKDNPEQKPFPRFWTALTEGGAAWVFQQLASVYLPATVVSGVRKGADSVLNQKPLNPLKDKHGLEWLLAFIEGPVSSLTRKATQVSQHLPVLKTLLAKPGAKTWVPTILATASIPLIIKPIDHLSEAVVNRTIKPTMDGMGRLFGIDRQTNPVMPTPNVLAHRAHQAFYNFNADK